MGKTFVGKRFEIGKKMYLMPSDHCKYINTNKIATVIDEPGAVRRDG